MSKVDAQRAMREAKYARLRASGPTRREAAAAEAPEAQASPTPTTEPEPEKKVAPTSEAPTGALCGHKSMNGRTCSREAGHSEKSHRYS